MEMKEFFNQLVKVVTEKAEVVSQKTGEVVDVVAKKTEQTVEVQKLKSQISIMERNNERDFKDIGKIIYDKYAIYSGGSIIAFARLEYPPHMKEQLDNVIPKIFKYFPNRRDCPPYGPNYYVVD